MSTKRKHEEVSKDEEEHVEEVAGDAEEDGDDGEDDGEEDVHTLKDVMLYLDPATKASLEIQEGELTDLLGSRGGSIVGDVSTATHILSTSEKDTEEYKTLSASGKPILTEEEVMILIRSDGSGGTDSKENRQKNLDSYFAAHGADDDDDDEEEHVPEASGAGEDDAEEAVGDGDDDE